MPPPPVTILYLHHARILGGAEVSLLNLFRNLDGRRFRPVVACPGAGPFAEALRAEGVESRPAEYPRLRNVAGALRAARRLSALAREVGAGLLHGNTPQSNLPAALAGWRAGAPVIWHMRNLPGPGRVDVERWLWRWPSRVICNSEAIRRRFPESGPGSGRVVTLLNGVDLGGFHPGAPGGGVRAEMGIPADAFVASILSRLAPEKGQRTFLRAARRLHGEFPEIHFLVVGRAEPGDKEFEAELRAEAGRLNGTVAFAGFRRDMPACFAASDVVVLASSAEPCGRVLFEAMASGKPVVGTESGGTPEIVRDGETGLLFPPGDDEALAGHLRRLYLDAQTRRAMGERGRRRAEAEFSIQAHTRRTEALYERVLEEAGRPVPALALDGERP